MRFLHLLRSRMPSLLALLLITLFLTLAPTVGYFVSRSARPFASDCSPRLTLDWEWRGEMNAGKGRLDVSKSMNLPTGKGMSARFLVNWRTTARL